MLCNARDKVVVSEDSVYACEEIWIERCSKENLVPNNFTRGNALCPDVVEESVEPWMIKERV